MNEEEDDIINKSVKKKQKSNFDTNVATTTTPLNSPILTHKTPSANISTSNHYDILSDLELSDQEEVGLIKKLKEKNKRLGKLTIINNNNQTTRNDLNENNNTTTTTKKVERIPPINIYNQDSSDIILLLKNDCKVSDFNIKRVNSNKHAIYLQHNKDFNIVKSTLQRALVPHFTYTPKYEKNKLVVLKGIDSNTDLTLILNELKLHESEMIKFIKVSKFKTSKQNAPFFLVQIAPETNIKDLKKINYVYHQKVQWEILKKTDITQCYRCQRFGHTAVNCNMHYRCVKCNEGHEPGKCKIDKDNTPRVDLFCVQCGEKGHPASYRGCPKHIALINLIKEKRNKRIENITLGKNAKKNMYNNFVDKNISFSSILNKDSQNIANDNNNNETLIGGQQPQNIFDMFEIIKSSIIQSVQSQMNEIFKIIAIQTQRIDTIYRDINLLNSQP